MAAASKPFTLDSKKTSVHDADTLKIFFLSDYSAAVVRLEELQMEYVPLYPATLSIKAGQMPFSGGSDRGLWLLTIDTI